MTNVHISLQPHQADALFGSLGTHSKCAGATLQLRDSFFTDRLGRKVLVCAQTQAAAATAIQMVLLQLSQSVNADADLEKTQWKYYDIQGKKQGPFPFSKMVNWADKQAFKNPSMPVQHSALYCWVPLWFLQVVAGRANGGAWTLTPHQQLADMDWEDVAESVRAERMRGSLASLSTKGHLNDDFAYLQSTGDVQQSGGDHDGTCPAPMDTDQLNTKRATIVIDTNALISHLSLLERALAAFNSLTDVDSTGAPVLEVQALVPWIALNELDSLKSSEKPSLAAAARHALQRLKVLMLIRDAGFHGQAAVEHKAAVEAGLLPTKGSSALHAELRNDTSMLQTCLYRASKSHDVAVLLLSNDVGLGVRSRAAGVLCLTASQLPRDKHAMLQLLEQQTATGDGPTTFSHQPAIHASAAGAPAAPQSSHQPSTGPGLAAVQAAHEMAIRLHTQQPQHNAALSEMQAPQQQQRVNSAPPPAAISAPQDLLSSLAIGPRPGFSWADEDESPMSATAAAQQAAFSLASQQLAAVVHQQQQQQLIQQERQAQLRQLSAVLQAVQRQQLNIQQRSDPGASSGIASAPGAAVPDVKPRAENKPPATHVRGPRHPETGLDVEQLKSMAERLEDAIVQGLQPAVQHYRQQDVGDLWLDLLKEEERPPWSAAQTIEILITHSSSYWKILSRGMDGVIRPLSRFLSSRAGGRAPPLTQHSLASAASSLLDIIVAFASKGSKAEADEDLAIDPATIPGFVSREVAAAALEQAFQQVQQLLQQLAV